MKDKKVIIIAVCIVTVIILIAGIFLIGIPMYLNYSARKELTETLETNTDESGTETISTQLEEQEKEIFNQSFMGYETEEGKTTPASTVLTLFSIISNSNEENPDRLIDVNGIVITKENLEPLEAIITNDTEYNIKCILGEDGYVKTIELRYN